MTGRAASAEGNARASLPKSSMAAFSAMIPQAMVDSSQAGEAERKNGRTATRSTRMPKTAEASSVRATAGSSGQPSATWKA